MIPLCIVLDTNVCLDLFVFNDRACIKLHEALRNGSVKAVTSEACRDEWLRVLDYSQIPLDASSRSQCIAEFDSIVHCINPIASSSITLPTCTDADDQKFLELARDSGVRFLITKDKALLKLNHKVRKAGMFAIIHPTVFRDSSVFVL